METVEISGLIYYMPLYFIFFFSITSCSDKKVICFFLQPSRKMAGVNTLIPYHIFFILLYIIILFCQFCEIFRLHESVHLL